jgi:hypothetical protein
MCPFFHTKYRIFIIEWISKNDPEYDPEDDDE